MDFSWTAEQREIYERALRFASQELNGSLASREPEHRFGEQEWRRCGEFGFFRLSVPEKDGGLELDCLTTARVFEALGRGCEDTGLVFSVASHLFACVMPICEFGSQELKEELLPDLCSGASIGGTAVSEANAGTDAFALAARATRRDDRYVLTGTKSWATNASVSDIIVIYASTNPDHGYLGISAFAVDRESAGLVVGEPYEKIGLTTSPSSAVYLDECEVPAARLLGDEGQGEQIFSSAMHWERTCLFASYLGLLDRQLEMTLAHAAQRKQFGKPLTTFQAVSHRLTDMKLRLEAARLLVYRACWLRDQRHADAALATAMAKVAVSEAAIQSGLDAIQIHGGLGVVRETGVERMLRDAVPTTIASGTSESQRNQILSELLMRMT